MSIDVLVENVVPYANPNTFRNNFSCFSKISCVDFITPQLHLESAMDVFFLSLLMQMMLKSH